MRNSDVSSANSFAVDTMSTDKSLMRITKKSRHKMDPCATPAFSGNHFNI